MKFEFRVRVPDVEVKVPPLRVNVPVTVIPTDAGAEKVPPVWEKLPDRVRVLEKLVLTAFETVRLKTEIAPDPSKAPEDLLMVTVLGDAIVPALVTSV